MQPDASPLPEPTHDQLDHLADDGDPLCGDVDDLPDATNSAS
jgi:hypothetical protein